MATEVKENRIFQLNIDNDIIPDLDSMFEEIREGWKNQTYPGATIEQIMAVEDKLGVKFPESYRRFLMFSDGAIYNDGAELFGIKGVEEVGDISTDRSSIVDVMRSMPDVPKFFIPIASIGAEHYFDTRTGVIGDFNIVTYDSDTKVEIVVASTFIEWLNQLIDDRL